MITCVVTQILKYLNDKRHVGQGDVAQNGVKINGTSISDENLLFNKGDTFVIQVGKRRFKRIKIC